MGTSKGLNTSALILTLAAFTNLGAVLGTVVLAANAVLLKVQIFASYVVDGLGFAVESLAGSYQGVGRRDQLRRLLLLGSIWGVVTGCSVAVIFAVFPEPLYGLLTSHDAVLVRLHRDTWWLLPVLGFGSLALILDGYFIGLTRGRVLARSMVWSTLVGFVPLATTAWYWRSPDLLWAAMALWMVLRAWTLAREVPATWRDPSG